jgi:fructokinase
MWRNLLHGLIHGMGHIAVKHDLEKSIRRHMSFHADCLEGLASGVAIEKRWMAQGGLLPNEHPAWNLEADYIAQALASYSFMLSPQRIIIGGGVGSLPHLLPKVQQRTQEIINGYIQSPVILDDIRSYIPQGLAVLSRNAGCPGGKLQS